MLMDHKLRISADNRLVASLKKTDNFFLLGDLVKTIRYLLCNRVNQKILKRLYTDKTFKIMIVDESSSDLGSASSRMLDAIYFPLRNTIYVIFKTFFALEQLQSILLNEFHSAAVRYANYYFYINHSVSLPEPGSSLKMVRPFLNGYWEDDLDRYREFESTIRGVMSRVGYFSACLRQDISVCLSRFMRRDGLAHQLGYELEFLKDYQPKLFTQKLSKEIYSRYLSSVLYPKIDSSNAIISYSHDLQFEVVSVSQNTVSVEMYSRFLIGKNLTRAALAFTHDFNLILNSIDQGYQDEHAVKLLELSSYFDEFSPGIKKYFMPEWCNYMSRYLRVLDYCAIRNSADREKINNFVELPKLINQADSEFICDTNSKNLIGYVARQMTAQDRPATLDLLEFPEKTATLAEQGAKRIRFNHARAEQGWTASLVYTGSLSEQLPLVQVLLHYVSKWMPWNKLRLATDEERKELQQMNSELADISTAVSALDSSIISESSILLDELQWLRQRSKGLKTDIIAIMQGEKTSESSMKEIKKVFNRMNEVLNSLLDHQMTLQYCEEESKLLLRQGQKLAVSYDLINHWLSKKVEEVISEENGDDLIGIHHDIPRFTYFSSIPIFWKNLGLPVCPVQPKEQGGTLPSIKRAVRYGSCAIKNKSRC